MNPEFIDSEYREIGFTQYVAPFGTKRQIAITRPRHVAEKADQIVQAGFAFEAEVLSTGQVSLTIHNLRTFEDAAIEIVDNGPGVGDAVDRLILNFNLEDRNDECI